MDQPALFLFIHAALGCHSFDDGIVNKGFARVETIKKFRMIEHQLTAEDEELTPTMKLKRKFVNEKYKGLIDSMYADAA